MGTSVWAGGLRDHDWVLAWCLKGATVSCNKGFWLTWLTGYQSTAKAFSFLSFFFFLQLKNFLRSLEIHMQLLRNNTERERGKIRREASVSLTPLPPVVTSGKTKEWSQNQDADSG